MTWRTEILASNPEAFWRVGESSGVTADDETANNNDLTYYNTPTLGVTGAVSGDSDTAIRLNGTDEYASNTNASYVDDTEGSIEFIFKLNAKDKLQFIVNVNEYVDSGADIVAVSIRDTNKLSMFGSSSGGGTNRIDGNTVLTTGQWYHVVATGNGTEYKIYLDGALESLTVVSGSNNGLWFGDYPDAILTNIGVINRPTPGFWLDGDIDEVVIHSTVLDLATVQQHNKWRNNGAPIELLISDIDHSHSVDSLVLDTAPVLVIPSVTHAHVMDSLLLGTQETLVISDTQHAHSVNSLLLGTQETLVIADVLHSHAVDQLLLIPHVTLSISDILHSHSVDQVVLVFTPYSEPDPNAVITYTCTISAPTFSDLVVPISSFQMTLRQSTNQCYLSVVIPKILDYADDINDRAAGEVTIAQLRDGVSTNLLTANLNTIRTDQGALNRTGTVVSYKQITFPGTGSFPLVGASYRSSTDSVRRYRATPHPSVKPTDEVTINGETFDVETVTWTVSVRTQVMEISELLP